MTCVKIWHWRNAVIFVAYPHLILIEYEKHKKDEEGIEENDEKTIKRKKEKIEENKKKRKEIRKTRQEMERKEERRKSK